VEKAARSAPALRLAPAFDPDLQPLYALTEPQYQAVINQLANLAVALIHHLQQVDQPALAHQIAGQAYDIFVNYDEDIAEHLHWIVRDAAEVTLGADE
jgi:hypothetical protein